MKPKVKFLTVMWGEEYIRRFAALSLPSLLAPGNLPALAASADLEVVIMTRHADIPAFERHLAFDRLRATCSIRFVDIDDLITGVLYGVTLTLAYARAVIACGQDMVNTHFVFMNADFVLADGSLRSLYHHIAAGRSIVLAPSFRATAEAVEPVLEEAVDASGVLSIPPRELVQLALPHPHPTTSGKIVNQAVCHSTHPNQFFWRVGDQTLIGRYYLIFMLCLKPERVITKINSYCDYSFIPELCPSGDEAVMGDSDEFFMLELQHYEQEMFLLRLGPQRERDAVANLSSWTTSEHRRAAKHDIVFHAGDLPPGVEQAKTDARAFVERLNSRLSPAIPHIDHPHWAPAVEAFLALRKRKGFPSGPAELEVESKSRFHQALRRIRSAVESAILKAYRLVMGQPPLVTPLSPVWSSYQHLREAVQSICAVPGSRLLFAREHKFIDGLVPRSALASFTTLMEIRRDHLPSMTNQTEDPSDVVVYLQGDWRSQLREAIETCAAIAERSGATAHILLQGHLDGLLSELLHYSGARGILRPASVSMRGGVLVIFNLLIFEALIEHYRRFGPIALTWVIPSMILAAPLVLSTNLLLAQRQGDLQPHHGATAVIRFDRV